MASSRALHAEASLHQGLSLLCPQHMSTVRGMQLRTAQSACTGKLPVQLQHAAAACSRQVSVQISAAYLMLMSTPALHAQLCWTSHKGLLSRSDVVILA